VTGIDRVTSASNGPLTGSPSIPSDAAAALIRAVTDPSTGAVDTGRLASVLSEMGDFQAASKEYAQIEAELSQRSPTTAAQFSRDVVDAFASAKFGQGAASTPLTFDAGNRAAPQALAQLLGDRGIRVSQNVSDGQAARRAARIGCPLTLISATFPWLAIPCAACTIYRRLQKWKNHA
jgi:hypothetical protein